VAGVCVNLEEFSLPWVAVHSLLFALENQSQFTLFPTFLISFSLFSLERGATPLQNSKLGKTQNLVLRNQHDQKVNTEGLTAELVENS